MVNGKCSFHEHFSAWEIKGTVLMGSVLRDKLSKRLVSMLNVTNKKTDVYSLSSLRASLRGIDLLSSGSFTLLPFGLTSGSSSSSVIMLILLRPVLIFLYPVLVIIVVHLREICFGVRQDDS